MRQRKHSDSNTATDSMRANIRWGVREGLFLTGIVFVPAILIILSRPGSRWPWFLAVLMSYLLFGAGAGALVGALRTKLAQWLPAMLVGGFLGGTGLMALVCIPSKDHPYPGPGVAIVTAALGMCVGGALGWWAWWRSRVRRQ
ncbi:MAG: hypothetical protein JWN79_88 [Gemmatimonadetes bacterium]|nr:hypothetical protein [Gemmatimonadota bacterium]